MDIFGGLTRWAGDVFNGGAKTPEPDVETAPLPTSDIARPEGLDANIEVAHDAFTSTDMQSRSSGAIKPMSIEGASGMIGNYQVETGDPTLRNTDVIEKKAKAGRGIAQYTAARRGPYDQARAEHIAAGGDPNDIDFQLTHAAREYRGDYDPNGNSLVGYTKSLSGETDGMNAEQSARHLRRDFFRPRVPHEDRRVEAANRVDAQIKQRNARIDDLASKATFKNEKTGTAIGSTRADGKRWAGDDHGWQSNPSFKKLIGY